jgi:hypothetical protein
VGGFAFIAKHLEHEATIALHTNFWMKKSENMLVWLSENHIGPAFLHRMLCWQKAYKA